MNASSATSTSFVDVNPSDLPGNGTQADPYVITNASELQAIEDDLDANYTLGADINATETVRWNNGTGFNPIGGFAFNDSTPPPFTGTFDGAGHTITGLTIDRPSEKGVGLFGYVGTSRTSGTVRNVSLVATSVNGYVWVGGLIGRPVDSTIQDVSAAGYVNGSSNVGGLIGILRESTLRNASAGGTVTGSRNVGGLVGNNFGTIREAFATANVTGPDYVGGLVGRNRAAIRETLATGDVSGSSHVGGLVGINDGGMIRNASATGDVTGDTNVGGLVGDHSDSVSATGIIRNAVAVGDVTGNTGVGGLVGTISRGATVRRVSAAGQVTGSESVGGLVGSNNGLVQNASASGRVTGTESVGGLIGSQGGTIHDASASGNVTGDTFIGGLAGTSFDRSTIRNVSATGAVNGSEDVGGLVGLAEGPIRNASASGGVTGSSAVGGLVGTNGFNNTIRTASATGDVNGSTDVGGLVGRDRKNSTIRNVSATGDVNGSRRVGGLVGFTGGFIGETDGVIREAFATGRVTGTTLVGGLVGQNNGTTTNESYWDVNATGMAMSAGNATGLTTAQMTGVAARTNMTGLEFGVVWATQSNDYPILITLPVGPTRTPAVPLQADVDPSDLPGTGTQTDPYVISNALELQAIEDDLDANYTLGADIDAAATAYWNNGHGFDPVGPNTSTPFTGTFDGNSHTIDGLVINRTTADNVALFGAIDGAVVRNVHLSAVDISGASKVGALVGWNIGTVRKSSMAGRVTGDINVGGLVGQNSNVITNSSADGYVDGTDEVGGLVGLNFEGGTTIKSSYATASVNGSSSVGGLVGTNVQFATVKNTYATGRVNGSQSVGGLVGRNVRDSTVSQSYAAGQVRGSTDVGGLVGKNGTGATVTDGYWDLNTTDQTVSAGGTGLTTAQMTGSAARANLSGFDFDAVWRIQPSDYPVLRSLSTPVQPVSLSISGGSVTPATVNESTTVTHDIGFVVENLSKDGSTDVFYVTFPDAVAGNNLSVSFANVTNRTDGSDVSITSSSNQIDGPDNDTVVDTLRFAVSPTGTGTVDVLVNVSVDVTWPAVTNDTTYDIHAAVNDSTTGAVGPTRVAGVTVRNQPPTGPAGAVSLVASNVATGTATAVQTVNLSITENIIDSLNTSVTNDTATVTIPVVYTNSYRVDPTKVSIKNTSLVIDGTRVASSDLSSTTSVAAVTDTIVITAAITNASMYTDGDGIQSLTGTVNGTVTYDTTGLSRGGTGTYTVLNVSDTFAFGPTPPASVAKRATTSAPPATVTPPALQGGNLTLNLPSRASVANVTASNTSDTYTLTMNVTGNATNVTVYLRASVIEDRIGPLQYKRLVINGTETEYGTETEFYVVVEDGVKYVAFVVESFSTKTITFEPAVTLGNVNGDGAINTGDVIQVQRSIVGLTTFSSSQTNAADVNQDGNVNTGDVIQIQRFIVGLSSVLD